MLAYDLRLNSAMDFLSPGGFVSGALWPIPPHQETERQRGASGGEGAAWGKRADVTFACFARTQGCLAAAAAVPSGNCYLACASLLELGLGKPVHFITFKGRPAGESQRPARGRWQLDGVKALPAVPKRALQFLRRPIA